MSPLLSLWLYMMSGGYLTVAKPPELVNAERYRTQIETASIEFEVTSPPEKPEPGYFTVKLAGEEMLYWYHGLGDGRFSNESVPGEPFAYTDLRYLVKDKQQWIYQRHNPQGNIKTEGIRWWPYYNIRELGFQPIPLTGEVTDHWTRTSAEAYVTSTRATEVEVLGYWSDGMTVRWILDAQRDMQPTHVAALVEGEEVSVCDTEYRHVDGVWFPESSVFTYKGEVITTVTITHAELNQPEHPQSFSPVQLGMIPGIEVFLEPQLGRYRWSGSELISAEDWQAGARDGVFDEEPLAALKQDLKSPSGAGRHPDKYDIGFLGLTPAVARAPGLWEDYTRRFIRFCQLDAAQTRKAWETLKECQKPAYQRLPGIQCEAKQLEAELLKLRAGSNGPPVDKVTAPQSADPASTDVKPAAQDRLPAKNTPPVSDLPGNDIPASSPNPQFVSTQDEEKTRDGRIKALDERLAEIYKPIETIFEKELKPGLNKLLTPDQKARVEEHDAEVRARRDAVEKKTQC